MPFDPDVIAGNADDPDQMLHHLPLVVKVQHPPQGGRVADFRAAPGSRSSSAAISRSTCASCVFCSGKSLSTDFALHLASVPSCVSFCRISSPMIPSISSV